MAGRLGAKPHAFAQVRPILKSGVAAAAGCPGRLAAEANFARSKHGRRQNVFAADNTAVNRIAEVMKS